MLFCKECGSNDVSVLFHEFPDRGRCHRCHKTVSLRSDEMENTMQPKIYFMQSTSREIHMIGDYVAVCFPLKYIPSVENGKIIQTPTRDLNRKPYIDFVDIRFDSDNEPYEDENSPVSGGIDVNTAKQVAGELALAINYIKSLNT